MVGIYARVSTEEQVKHGFSLMDQLRECRLKAATDELQEYVDEGVSGEFLDRPALSRLREDVRAGRVDKVICLDPDRLSRKLMNQLILSDEIEARAKLVFVNGDYAQTPEGQLFYQMRGAISQFEKAKITERMSRGRREKARQGRVLRDFHIYGYDYDRRTEQFVVNDREAAVVRMVFDLFTQPNGRVQGMNGIARYLTNLGIPTKRGGKVFHRQVVRQMLMNRAYIGEFYQNKWNTEGMLGNKYRPREARVPQRLRPPEEWIQLPIPAIIEKQTFDAAQALLEGSRRRWSGTSRHRYLLSGLVRCAACGNTLTGRMEYHWGTRVPVYTDKKGTVGARHPGCGTTVRCEELDREIWQALMSWLGDKALRQGWPKPASHREVHGAQLEQYRRELTRLETLCTRLLDMLGDADLDVSAVRERLHKAQGEQQRIQGEIDSELEMIHELESQSRAARTRFAQAWQAVNRLGPEQMAAHLQRELVRCLVREVLVSERGSVVQIVTF